MAVKLGITGIRGTQAELDPATVCSFSESLATYLNAGCLALGGDTRPSTPVIRRAVRAGLLSCGVRVLDFGVLPTPLLQWLIPHLGLDGGVSLSAGHNPDPWNALLFLGADGAYLLPVDGEGFLNSYHAGAVARRPFDALGRLEETSEGVDAYFRALPGGVDQRENRTPLTFVFDCAGGACAAFLEPLSRHLGVRLIPLFCTRGSLIRNPEPTRENGEILGTVVRETGADGGFMVNTDGSRILMVDHTGRVYSEELTLPVFARMVLADEAGDLVSNWTSSRILDQVAEPFGASVHRTDVGPPAIAEAVMDLGVHVGGEGSGSVLYAPFSYGFDSFYFVARLVAFLRREGVRLADVAGDLADPDICKETLNLPPERVYRALETLETEAVSQRRLKDGYYLEGPGWWLSVRASSTLSMIRLIGEGEGLAPVLARMREVIR